MSHNATPRYDSGSRYAVAASTPASAASHTFKKIGGSEGYGEDEKESIGSGQNSLPPQPLKSPHRVVSDCAVESFCILISLAVFIFVIRACYLKDEAQTSERDTLLNIAKIVSLSPYPRIVR